MEKIIIFNIHYTDLSLQMYFLASFLGGSLYKRTQNGIFGQNFYKLLARTVHTNVGQIDIFNVERKDCGNWTREERKFGS